MQYTEKSPFTNSHIGIILKKCRVAINLIYTQNMTFSVFLTHAYIIIAGLVSLVIYLYAINNKKICRINRKELCDLNNQQTISALALLIELIEKHQNIPNKRSNDLFYKLIKKTVHVFGFDYAVVYSKGFEIISEEMPSNSQTSSIIMILEEKKRLFLEAISQKGSLIEVIEQEEYEDYLYILKLLENPSPQYVVFVQKLHKPITANKNDIAYHQLYKSFLPQTLSVMSSSVLSLLLLSLKNDANPLPLETLH